MQIRKMDCFLKIGENLCVDLQCTSLYEANHGNEEKMVQPDSFIQLDFIIAPGTK